MNQIFNIKHIFFCGFICIISQIQVKAQSPTDFFVSFQKGDFTSIEIYLNAEIDLCINDVTEFNTRNIAINRLKKFYNAEVIKSVEEIHQGSSKKSSAGYKVAKVTTDKGIYRLFVYSEVKDKKLKVKEVRIDKF